MPRSDHIEMDGIISDALGGGKYSINVRNSDTVIMAQLSGRMKKNHIRVLPGDRVRVSVSPYDLTHGLIVFRAR